MGKEDHWFCGGWVAVCVILQACFFAVGEAGASAGEAGAPDGAHLLPSFPFCTPAPKGVGDVIGDVAEATAIFCASPPSPCQNCFCAH